MNQISETAEVVIIGGGVIGLAVARALALRGVRDVVLIERNSLGAEASSAAAGMLAPQVEADRPHEFFHLTCQSRDMYPAFAAALLDETGIDIELETTGTLYLALDEFQAADLERRYDWQKQAGLPIEKLTFAEAKSFERTISDDVCATVWFPRDYQVENRRLISALEASNKRLGVQLETGADVRALKIERGRITGVETSRGSVATDQVVIAGGAWSSLLGAGDIPVPHLRIRPVRGQMLCFRGSPRVARPVIHSMYGYIVPRRDGRLLVGSTTESVGFEKRVTVVGVSSMLKTALEMSPRMTSLEVLGFWSGLRPRAGDTLPVLGPCAEIAGVFYATGHYRNGILLAPITGELIASAIVDSEFRPELNIFSPDRFGMTTISHSGVFV
jgi:glycine oxidase